MNYQKKRFKETKAITLIALVITIIVLLILAGITIAALSGNNGILTNATKAKEETEKGNIIELAKTDLIGEQVKSKSGEVTGDMLKEVLDKYFGDVPNAEDITLDTPITAKEEYGSYKMKVSDIYDGEIKNSENEDGDGDENEDFISKETSYVGYYADLNADKTPEGIIYADLATGAKGDGQWTDSNGNYTIPVVKDNLKDYYVIQTGYDGPFGKKDVLCSTGSGKERFYIMALEDLDNKQYYWYYNAYGDMTDYATATSKNFETGKTNTATMITKYKNRDYGDPFINQYYSDMWGNESLKTKVAEGWFVPSSAEWSAFAEELKITDENYEDYDLSDQYWSSSQNGSRDAFNARFISGRINGNGVNSICNLRLSTIF